MLASLAFQTSEAKEINASGADGLVAYVPTLPGNVVFYRTWSNDNKNFSDQASTINSLTNNVMWANVRANHERDEFLMSTFTSGTLRIHTQVFNGTGWNNLTQHTATAENAAQRQVDAAYEDLSGDALIVFENSSTADDVFAFTIWNGTAYASPRPYHRGSSAEIRWIRLVPKPASDDIMLILLDNQLDMHAVLWNGTDFDASTALNLTTVASTFTEEQFDFSWESLSGDGLMVYGVSTPGISWAFRTYDASTKLWSSQGTFFTLNGGAPRFTRLCSDPNSDYVGAIFYDTTSDVNVRMWDGELVQNAPAPPSEDATTEASASARHANCQWVASGAYAAFVFVDAVNFTTLTYVNFTQSPDAWSVSNLELAAETSAVGSNRIRAVDFVSNPVTDEIMAVTLDINENARAVRWNATGWILPPAGNIPLEATTECLDGQTGCAGFDWFRYDPAPNVTIESPLNGTNFAANALAAFNVSVRDNVNSSFAMANITLPNGTLVQLPLSKFNSTYFNASFSQTGLNGTYTFVIIANDSVGLKSHQNLNTSQQGNFTVADFVAPNVTLILPTAGQAFNQSNAVNITANVSDNVALHRVIANVTLPNASVEQLNLTTSGGITYTANFTNTGTSGNYSVRIHANDTSGNLNGTQTVNFSVGDATPPRVADLTPAEGSAHAANTTIPLTANVSDEVNLSSVRANVTLPNSTILQLLMTDVDLNGTFEANLTVTPLMGNYSFRLIANDTSNNVNSSLARNFSVGDVVFPSVLISAPANLSNSSNSTQQFTFTATDNAASTLNCSLYLNGAASQSNSTVFNNTPTTFEATGLSDGSHSWNVSCSDALPNTNTTLTRIVNVDTKAPNFVSLDTFPADEQALDPNVQINVTANLTDNVTAPHTVFLQRKLSNETNYTNQSMAYNASSGLFEANFTPSLNGTYELRLWANDTVGNGNFSNGANRSVQLDSNWTRSPAAFAPVGGGFNASVHIGNLTLNNTADVSLNFTVSSDFANVSFNETFPLNISANTVKQVRVNASTNSTPGAISILLTISSSSEGVPSTLTTSASVVVAEDAFLSATVTSAPTSVRRGDTGVEIVTKIKNVGSKNASNVTLYTGIPPEWTLTFGSLTLFLSELNVSEEETNIVQATIPSNATLGTQFVYANATGSNFTGTNLETLSAVLNGSASVVVLEATAPLGTSPAPSSSGTGSSGTTSGSTSSQSVATASKPESKLQEKLKSSFIESNDTVRVTRGTQIAFPLKVRNPFANVSLQNISLFVEGPLAQFISYSPESLHEIRYGEEKSFEVVVRAPAYQEKEAFEVTFFIRGKAVSEGEEVEFVERRVVTVFITFFTRVEVTQSKLEAEQAIRDMEKAGFSARQARAYFEELEKALAEEDFDRAEDLKNLILALRNDAVEASRLIQEVRQAVERGTRQGFDVSEAKKLLALAEAAFASEDYETAKERARQALLVAGIEASGANVFGFLVQYWPFVGIFLAGVGIFAVIAYQREQARRLHERLDALAKEELQVFSLMREAQDKCFKKQLLSLSDYYSVMHKLEKRLEGLHRERSKLRRKRLLLSTPEQELEQLAKEKAHLLRLLQSVQEMRFVKRKLGQEKYEGTRNACISMLNEVEEELAVLTASLRSGKRSGKDEGLKLLQHQRGMP